MCRVTVALVLEKLKFLGQVLKVVNEVFVACREVLEAGYLGTFGNFGQRQDRLLDLRPPRLHLEDEAPHLRVEVIFDVVVSPKEQC